MRRARLTWQGAFHHLMNRGIEGKDIFCQSECKAKFLQYLEQGATKLKQRIFAYCIMDNHFHIVMQNSSGRLADFMKYVNGCYGQYYQKKSATNGYVFQGRYESTLIENDSYLLQCVGYVLLNPVKAKICPKAKDYPWSSVQSYFSKNSIPWLDNFFVEDIAGDKLSFQMLLNEKKYIDLKIKKTGWGGILGGENFLNESIQRYDRRSGRESLEMQRIEDKNFDPIAKVIQEFEKKFKIDINSIDTRTRQGKGLRAELLVRLKDLSGLKYREIAKIDIFADLRISSLRSIYRNVYRSR
jgi:REP element-mobilizing transposase RayT